MNKKRFLFLLLGSVTTVVLAYTSYVLITAQFQAKKQMYLSDRIKSAQLQYDILNRGYNTFAAFIFREIINTPDVAKIMYRAKHGFEKERQLQREILYKKFEVLYSGMKKDNIRQLHFHLPGAISFLRFHRPKKFGDDLSGVRPAIVRVNETRMSVSGFEEGRIFNGMRHVFPLYYFTEFVGTVEISHSMKAFVDSSVQEKGYSQYHLLLNRSIIEEKVFKEERSNYQQSSLNKDLIYDKELYQTYLDRGYSKFEGKGSLLEAMGEKLKAPPSKSAPSIEEILYHKEYYTIVSDPIYNINKKQVAYFLTLYKDRPLGAMYGSYTEIIYIAFVASALVGFLMVFIAFFLYGKMYGLDVLAHTDTLTQISNRAYLYKKLKNIIEKSNERHSTLSIIFFDVDLFKKVNDTFGHDVGDRVLQMIASLVKGQIRKDDIFARWGGEEFMLVLPESSKEVAVQVAEKLRVVIAQHPFKEGQITCSFGVVQWKHKEHLNELIKRADALLYEAKEQGRNRVNA